MTLIKTCPLCQSSKYQALYQLSNFDILKCNKCQLHRRNLKLSVKKRQQLYSKAYFTKDQKEYFAPCLKDIKKEDYRIKDFSNRLTQLNKLIKTKNKTLLDIGCATGAFVKLALVDGWQAQGIDISKYAVKLAQKQKLEIKRASIESFIKPKKKFTAITAWEVVPNFENPNLGIKKIKSMLKPNGVLAIQLTVVDSLLFDLSRFLYLVTFGQLKFFIENGYPVNHTCHFSRKTLTKFLKLHGFKIIKTNNIEFNFKYSKMPRVVLPILSLIGFIAKSINRTTQVRVFAKLN